MTDYDLWGLEDGDVLQTHGPSVCAGSACCLHNPSGHHMNTWPLSHKRLSFGWLSSRVCKHSGLHPDPDSVAYLMGRSAGATRSIPPVRFGPFVGTLAADHGCQCRCCEVPANVG